MTAGFSRWQHFRAAMGLSAERYGPSDSIGQPNGWLVRMLGGGKTKAGVVVSEFGALHLPVVFACVNRIANPVAGVPVGIFRKGDKGEAIAVDDHPMSQSLRLRPNPFMSSRTVRKTVQGHALLWGNGYCEIERNRRGQAVGIWPLLPNATKPRKKEGDLVYDTSIAGQRYTLPQEDVIHLMDLSQDGYEGLSQIGLARQAVGMGLAMEEFGAKFFANDAKSGGFLMHPGRLSSNAQGNLAGRRTERGETAGPERRIDPGAQLEKQGGLENAHRVKVLEEGVKYISTTIPPEDAQFLGSREFQIAEIARIYDVPLVLLQSHEKSTSWGSGIEQLMIGFVRQTIEPWIGAWEQELNWKLFTAEELAQGYYVKFNLNALLRGDMAGRAAFYKAMFELAAITPNKIAALEELDGMGPEGDVRFVSNNVQSIERAINPPVPPPIGHNGGPPLDQSDEEDAA
ncbi:Phage portal protein [Bosea sp. LC85]|uniref:phage portal protein n=1 Tax=Bosea sp. LC85 TaxID=1502851 RepID=UPI0004E37FCC|nr:phage portal protein [Bosea sp. LC85]KFC73206.1 Phage portal protein [Bosea sp. LC85]